MNKVVLAIYKRNFSSYLQNPIGYVFITLFVFLSGLAAFWPPEFWASNLATLDQLNKYFPLIMLVFVPAITMSIWAEERRQGTDELLLTLPATDFDVVFGKYLAAAAIYSISLAFSLVCNLFVLEGLGNPDLGLFFTNYFGYWLVGLAMLAIGMAASFLTTNITVAFVLSAFFNVLFIAPAYADRVLPPSSAQQVSRFSIPDQLRDFTLGLVSAASTAYFLLIVVAMLYLSMVLIGRRHWLGGRDGKNLGPHYLARFIALAAGAAGLFLIFLNQTTVSARFDLSAEQLASLHPASREIIRGLDAKKPIVIEAFISPQVPQNFVEVRLDLLARLREIKASGGANVTLYVNDTEAFQPEAKRAETTFGITGREIEWNDRGQSRKDTVFLGVALTSGLEKIVIPFVEPSTPIEFELVRSIAKLNGVKPRKVGLYTPQVPGRDPRMPPENGFQEYDPRRQNLKTPEFLVELRKQYEVLELDADEAIPDTVDVVMAIQPSVMPRPQLDHLYAAVKRGVPTLIFQDPESSYFPLIQSAGERVSGGQAGLVDPALDRLWELLGVRVSTGEIVSQVGYNPLKQYQTLPPEFVFIGNGAIKATDPNGSLFDEQDPISRGTQELVFMYAGSVAQAKGAKTKFVPLVRTTNASGVIDRSELFIGGMRENPRPQRRRTGVEYALVAHVTGAPVKDAVPTGTAGTATPTGTASLPAVVEGVPSGSAGKAPANQPAADEQAGPDGTSQKPADAASAPKNEAAAAPTASASASPTGTATASSSAGPAASPTASPAASPTGSPTASPSGTPAKPPEPRGINAVIVTDLDMMTTILFELRSQRQSAEERRPPNFDNVAFLFNAIDVLAGDTKYVEIRKRRPQHRTLEKIEEIYKRNAEKLETTANEYNEQMKAAVDQLKASLDQEEEKLKNATNLKQIDKEARLAIFQNDRIQRTERKQEELQTRFDKEAKELEQQLNESVNTRKGFYKALAVFIPPIFPFLIGLAVFFSRRAGEQEGVARSRLR
jgi:ABC-2 type transport system permease protein